MKRFLTNIVLFIVIILSITLIVNLIYIKVKLEPQDSDHTLKFRNVPNDIEMCNFGSSHGFYGFNYQDFPEKVCFNFGLPSQSISYDMRLYENYEHCIQKGAYVILPVSYFSLFGYSETKDENFESKNKRYYKILPRNKIKNYSFVTDLYVNYLPLLAEGERFVDAWIRDDTNINDDTWSRITSAEAIGNIPTDGYRNHIIEGKIDEKGNRIINREEVDSLICIIEECYENGYTPIVVTTPYLREYTEMVKMMDPQFYDEFYDLIDEIVDETGVRYYDYSFDERFSSRYEWFMNPDHLNKEGARQFCNILFKEVVR